jgi:hypothetical protein
LRKLTQLPLLRGIIIALGLMTLAGIARADESPALFFALATPDQFDAGGPSIKSPVQRELRNRHAYRGADRGRGSVGMIAGVSAPLAAKAREIASACGASVISGHRRTRVAGTGRMSLHASGRAVDMRGNPSCIYAHLRGWPGGYSTDYGRVKHVHISLGGSEDGLRFAHGGHHRHYAHAGHRGRFAHAHSRYRVVHQHQHRYRYARA